MTVLDEPIDLTQYGNGSLYEHQPPRRKVRGLRFPVIPTGGWLAQVGGGISALVGCYLQFGLAVTLMAGGLAAVVLGSLREAEKI